MKHFIVKITTIMILLITTASIATPTHWRIIKPGIEYTKISMLSGFHMGYLHAFRIDLAHYHLAAAMANDTHTNIASVSDLVTHNKALIGINGGFFSQELQPLGLRISNYQVRNPLKPISWWGVFYVQNNHAYIVAQKNFRLTKQLEFAIQSGPRLINQGTIASTLKPGVDSRSAIGITATGKVILVVTDNLRLTTTELAQLMMASQMQGGLNCENALNLDGGSSSQLYAQFNNFSLNVAGYSAVTDALVVMIPN